MIWDMLPHSAQKLRHRATLRATDDHAKEPSTNTKKSQPAASGPTLAAIIVATSAIHPSRFCNGMFISSQVRRVVGFVTLRCVDGAAE